VNWIRGTAAPLREIVRKPAKLRERLRAIAKLCEASRGCAKTCEIARDRLHSDLHPLPWRLVLSRRKLSLTLGASQQLKVLDVSARHVPHRFRADPRPPVGHPEQSNEKLRKISMTRANPIKKPVPATPPEKERASSRVVEEWSKKVIELTNRAATDEAYRKELARNIR